MPISTHPETDYDKEDPENQVRSCKKTDSTVEKDRHTYRNVLELSTEDKKVLKESIARFDGTIRVFVHPYFDFYNYFPPELKYQWQHFINRQHTARGIEKLLNAPDAKVPPIIIFEENDHIQETLRELGSSPTCSRKVYIVPTHETDPEPIIFDKEIASLEELDIDGRQQLRDKNWERLLELLNELGVKKSPNRGSLSNG